MAKRKTIGENPLDPIAPDRTMRRTDESAAAANAQSVDPATGRTGTPAPATQVAQPPSPADLVNRVR